MTRNLTLTLTQTLIVPGSSGGQLRPREFLKTLTLTLQLTLIPTPTLTLALIEVPPRPLSPLLAATADPKLNPNPNLNPNAYPNPTANPICETLTLTATPHRLDATMRAT